MFYVFSLLFPHFFACPPFDSAQGTVGQKKGTAFYPDSYRDRQKAQLYARLQNIPACRQTGFLTTPEYHLSFPSGRKQSFWTFTSNCVRCLFRFGIRISG